MEGEGVRGGGWREREQFALGVMKCLKKVSGRFLVETFLPIRFVGSPRPRADQLNWA